MENSKHQSMGLRILAGRLLKQQLPELEVERSLAQVLASPPFPQNWVMAEQNYAVQVCVILLRKFEGKIETLVLKILELALATYHSQVEYNNSLLMLNVCSNFVQNSNLDGKVHTVAYKLIEKIVGYFDKERLLFVSPMILGRLIKAVTGDYSRKDVFLKNSIHCFEVFIQRWTTECSYDNKAIESFRIESNKAKAQQELLMIGTEVSTKTIKIPTLETKYKTSKEIQDFLFETFYHLSPLHSSKSFLPSLSESVLKEYAKTLHDIANYLRLLPVIMIPLTSICLFLIPYSGKDFSYDFIPSPEDFQSLLGFSKEVDSKKCLSKLKVLTLLAQNEDLKVRSLFSNLTIQEYINLIPFNSQMLEIISEVGNASEDDFKDDIPINEKVFSETQFKMFHDVINFVKDYFPSIHFSKEIIAEFFLFVGKAMTRETILQLISHLEDFVSFADSLPVPSQSSINKPPQRLAISIFDNSVRRYSAVQEPLEDLASVFLILIGLVSSCNLQIEDLERLLIATTNTKRSAEAYLDCAVMPAACKKLHRTVIIGQCLLLLTKTKGTVLTKGVEPQLADLESYVSTMLTVEGTSSLHLGLAKQSIRLLAYQLGPFAESFGWTHPLSADDLVSNLSFNIVERLKLVLLNYPNSPTITSTMHLMAGLSHYAGESLSTSLLPLLHTSFVSNYRPARLLPLLQVFRQLLVSLHHRKADLQTASRSLVDAGDRRTIANVVRKVGLQAFAALASSANNLAVEILWACAALVLEVFLDVPMALEEQSSPFFGNEPAHCVVDNTGGAFVVEIWPVLIKELQTMCSNFLLGEESFGSLVLEVMQSRTDRKREHLKLTIIQKVKEQFNFGISPEQSQNIIESSMYFGRECNLVIGKPQPSKHSNLLLLPCLAFLAKVRKLNPSILSKDRLKIIIDHLAIPFLTIQIQTVTQAKILIEIARIWQLADEQTQNAHYKTIFDLKLEITKHAQASSNALPSIVKKYLDQFIAENSKPVE